ncbi:hypothetical protein [Sphingomonas sp. Leaf242]|uniref:hypothetical protein n=1 Tax=Sphingomonas sp. Leaf242 TaxID=1736304 RepID=UPI0012E0D625|nr:hypothetical protein [Sphingomonas sp. Leaf242]
MTDAQGDLLGSVILLLSTALLLGAVHFASTTVDRRKVRWLTTLSVILSIAGVAIVIVTLRPLWGGNLPSAMAASWSLNCPAYRGKLANLN